MLASSAVFLITAGLVQTPAPRAAGAPIPVLTSVDRSMFPSMWTTPDINATALPLDAGEVDRSLEVVRRAMEKYPADVLGANLKRVYVCSRLTFYGLSYGATNSADSLYLANRGKKHGFSDRYLEESFHHEFSSILLRNYPDFLDSAAWLGANGLPYRGDGTQAVRDGTASTRYSRDYHDKGFLAQYATASMEEDFNMMAEGLIGGNPEFWRAVDTYPRLRTKLRLTVRFYAKLNAIFTENQFRSFASRPVR